MKRGDRRRLSFGRGQHQWSAVNPVSLDLHDAIWRAIHTPELFTSSDRSLLVDAVATYRYLVWSCPTTAIAVAKVRAIRCRARC